MKRNYIPTQNELCMLELASQGKNWIEIAKALTLNHNSVRTFAYRLYKRIGATNLPHAIGIAYRKQWLFPIAS